MLMPPSKMEMRNLLADFAKDDLYMMFSEDYEDYILTGFTITGEGLRLPLLLNYLRKNGIPVLSYKANPIKVDDDDFTLWWEILLFKYSNEN